MGGGGGREKEEEREKEGTQMYEARIEMYLKIMTELGKDG